MKVIILAAGYGTRLYPLTKTIPKPLIKVGGQCLLEYIFPTLNTIKGKIFIVTNDKFYNYFLDWSKNLKRRFDENLLNIINNGTKDEETRLGAIGDINFVIEKEKIDDDLLVIAGDNFLSEFFNGFIDFGKEKNTPILAIYDVKDLEKMKKYSEVDIDKNNQIIFFEEKPENPKSTYAGIALYYYPRQTLPLIKKYLEEDNNKDQPGRFIEWLYKQTPVFTWKFPGVWFDVGTHESLKEAEEFIKNNFI
jgi:glucose-1-phosphate thymidylyltransferase